jgi:hypothetical protein
MLVLALSHGFRLLVFIDHKKWQFAAVAPREGGAHVIAVDQQSWREGLKIRGEMNGVCRFPDAAFCISDADYHRDSFWCGLAYLNLHKSA